MQKEAEVGILVLVIILIVAAGGIWFIMQAPSIGRAPMQVCQTDAECNDYDPCTRDYCLGRCVHIKITPCVEPTPIPTQELPRFGSETEPTATPAPEYYFPWFTPEPTATATPTPEDGFRGYDIQEPTPTPTCPPWLQRAVRVSGGVMKYCQFRYDREEQEFQATLGWSRRF